MTLYWTNAASYGGNISFGAYAINESVNGAAYSTVDTITQAGTQSYTVDGSAYGTAYQFYIATTDEESSNYYAYRDAFKLTGDRDAPRARRFRERSPSLADVGQLIPAPAWLGWATQATPSPGASETVPQVRGNGLSLVLHLRDVHGDLHCYQFPFFLRANIRLELP